MKRRNTKTSDPLDGEIDFSRFGPMRRDAFAGAGEPEGPSLLSLWEMPQLSADAIVVRRGHPGKGVSRPTVVRSIRLPAEVWEKVEEKARSQGLNVHQAMQVALVGWLRRAG